MERQPTREETAYLVRFYRAFGAEYGEGEKLVAVGDVAIAERLADDGMLIRRGEGYALAVRTLELAATVELDLDDSQVRRLAAPRAAPRLDAVTRKFLEEVLSEASIPAELMDVIVAAYEEGGELRMSEDGGRYIVHLVKS